MKSPTILICILSYTPASNNVHFTPPPGFILILEQNACLAFQICFRPSPILMSLLSSNLAHRWYLLWMPTSQLLAATTQQACAELVLRLGVCKC